MGNLPKEAPFEVFRFSLQSYYAFHGRKSLLCKRERERNRHGELAKHLRRYVFSVRRVPTSRQNSSFFVAPPPLLPPPIPSPMPGSLGISLTPLHPHPFLLRAWIHAWDVSFTSLYYSSAVASYNAESFSPSTRKSSFRRFPHALIPLACALATAQRGKNSHSSRDLFDSSC